MKAFITVCNTGGISTFEFTTFPAAAKGAYNRIVGDAEPGSTVTQFAVEITNEHMIQQCVVGHVEDWREPEMRVYDMLDL